MALPKFFSASSLSVAGVVLLVGGLGIAIFASGQQQDNRSEAASIGDQIVNDATISSTSSTGYTKSGLIAGAEYKVVISGTFKFNSDSSSDPMVADAQWVAHSCSTASNCAGKFTDHNNAVSLNGTQSTSSDYKTSANSSHVYTWYLKPSGTSLKVHIVDSNYDDNTGSLKMDLFISKLPVTPTKTPTPTNTPAPQQPTNTPAPTSTIFNLDLLFHGIGKGGDNRNPNGGGNQNPLHPTRSVIVDVYDFDNNPVVTGKEGQVTFDPITGTYKGTIVMGTTLTSQAYAIKVKLSHSLRASISRNITAGTTNSIPVINLVNGDTNNDAKLDIEDYNIIQGCYSDFDLPPVDCNVTKKAQADIDDDGNVNQFDMNLFLREMSVQQL